VNALFPRLLLTVVFILMVVVVVSAGLVLAQTENSSRSSQTLDGDNLNVGDLVAQGSKLSDGTCGHSGVRIRTRAVKGKTRTITVESDSQCTMVVTENSETNTLPRSPAINPIPEHARSNSAPSLLPKFQNVMLEPNNVSLVAGRHVRIATARFRRTVARQFAFGQVENEVFMYGFGGSGDKLTQKFGILGYEYTGSSVVVNYANGWCYIPGNNGWIINSCTFDLGDSGPGSLVFRQGSGNYHWDPFYWVPSYNHTLTDYEEAYDTGAGYCNLYFDGSIVLGVGMNCGGY
jgi:hypothetical protein